MIKTFDFLYSAWDNPKLMEQLLTQLNRHNNAQIQIGTVLLHFDSTEKVVTACACRQDSPFASRTIPKRITYSAIKKLLEKDFDHFLPNDITDIPDD